MNKRKSFKDCNEIRNLTEKYGVFYVNYNKKRERYKKIKKRLNVCVKMTEASLFNRFAISFILVIQKESNFSFVVVVLQRTGTQKIVDKLSLLFLYYLKIVLEFTELYFLVVFFCSLLLFLLGRVTYYDCTLKV